MSKNDLPANPPARVEFTPPPSAEAVSKVRDHVQAYLETILDKPVGVHANPDGSITYDAPTPLETVRLSPEGAAHLDKLVTAALAKFTPVSPSEEEKVEAMREHGRVPIGKAFRQPITGRTTLQADEDPMEILARNSEPATKRLLADTHEMGKARIHVVSLASYSHLWDDAEKLGASIISRWRTAAEHDHAGFIQDRIEDAATADAVVAYTPKNLGGAHVLPDIGAALSMGVPVFLVGGEGQAILAHPGITLCEDLRHALICATNCPQVSHHQRLAKVQARDLDVSSWPAQLCRFEHRPQQNAGGPYISSYIAEHWMVMTPSGEPGRVGIYRRNGKVLSVTADNLDLKEPYPATIHQALIQATRLFLAEQWLASNPHITVADRS